jgi:hypothetical protein
MKKNNKVIITLALIIAFSTAAFSQLTSSNDGLSLKLKNGPGSMLKSGIENSSTEPGPLQKPTKKIYFVPGGKIGMFFLQGDFTGNQMIALEIFGKYVGEGFFAEISLPFRFKTSPAFTDIGLDVNVFYPFLGKNNKSEIEPFAGGGLGLHFIGMDKDDPNSTKIAARGGMGLNLIVGATFFKSYDFNIIMELKYFNYLREFDNRRYQGIGLNVGATFPR